MLLYLQNILSPKLVEMLALKSYSYVLVSEFSLFYNIIDG
jgi:hypothetical protein